MKSEAEKSEREFAEAQAQLQSLVDERDTLSAQLAQASAAENVDGETLVRLQQRSDEIGVHVYAASVRAQRARISVLESRLAAEQEAERYELAAASVFYGRLQAAQAAYDVSVIDCDAARTQVALTTGDVNSARRELDRVIRENSQPRGAVVRSRLHAA